MRGAGFIVPLLILGTAACTNAAEPSPAADDAPRQPAVPSGATPPPPRSPGQATVASLAGEWRVAGIDGRSFDEAYGIALSGHETELWWEPRCAGQTRSYRIAGAAISFDPVVAEGAPPAPGSSPPPVCAIAVPPRLADVVRALDAATRVERTPSNGVLISGGGHSLTLFSQ